jgi:hypothetical protein
MQTCNIHNAMTLSKHARPGVQAGVSALEARLRRNKTLLGRSLLFDVLELWPNLGDGGLRKAAYRGGWKPT